MTTKTKVAYLLIAAVIGLSVLVLDVRLSNTTAKTIAGSAQKGRTLTSTLQFS